MAFVAMHHLDFGEAVAEAGTVLEGIERCPAFRGLYGTGAIVPDVDPRAPEVSGPAIKFGKQGEIEIARTERDNQPRSGRGKKHDRE